MLTRAVLVKLTTDDGLVTVDALAAGAVVSIESRSRHTRTLYHHASGRFHEKQLVLAVLAVGVSAWLPTELLRIDE